MTVGFAYQGICIIEGRYFPYDVHVCMVTLLQKNEFANIGPNAVKVEFTESLGFEILIFVPRFWTHKDRLLIC